MLGSPARREVFRDDREALRAENEALRGDVERLRAENAALRQTVGALSTTGRPVTPRDVYRDGPDALTEGERLMMGAHALTPFPAWAVLALHLATGGAFSLVYFGAMHGRLPRLAHNDPDAGRAVGLLFVPYFNFYWVFFAPLRLVDRLNFQFALRRDPRRASRALVMAAATLGLLAFFVTGAVLVHASTPLLPLAWVASWLLPWGAVAYDLQRRVNELVALGPVRAAPATYDVDVGYDPRTAVRVDAAPEAHAPAHEVDVGSDAQRAARRAQNNG